jgi:hypothetical protein
MLRVHLVRFIQDDSHLVIKALQALDHSLELVTYVELVWVEEQLDQI